RRRRYTRVTRRRSVVVAQEPSKLLGRVRFPSPALVVRGPTRGPDRHDEGPRQCRGPSGFCGRCVARGRDADEDGLLIAAPRWYRWLPGASSGAGARGGGHGGSMSMGSLSVFVLSSVG